MPLDELRPMCMFATFEVTGCNVGGDWGTRVCLRSFIGHPLERRAQMGRPLMP